MNLALTKVGEWIVLTLCRRVRVFTLDQIASAWFEGDARKARAEIRRLTKLGFVEVYQNLVGERPPVDKPLLVWKPGDGKQPKFHKIAYQSSSRWGKRTRQEQLVIATKKAIQTFAGYTNGKLPTECALRHDLAVSSIYLHFLKTDPRRARNFIGEDHWVHLGHSKNKHCVPDAVIRHRRNHRLNVLIEQVGDYPKERLVEFHRCFMHFNYELY